MNPKNHPEPSTTAELAWNNANKYSYGGELLNAREQFLAGYRARDAEVERLETARKVHVEELHNADAELTQLRQSLADSERKAAELEAIQAIRHENHEILMEQWEIFKEALEEIAHTSYVESLGYLDDRKKSLMRAFDRSRSWQFIARKALASPSPAEEAGLGEGKV